MLAWSVLFAVLCLASASTWHYPDLNAVSNGWPLLCSSGTKQSPIDIDNNTIAEFHAPIKYKNYFTNPDHNNKWFKGYLKNNGHTVVWFPSKNTEEYELKKCMKTMSCPSIQEGPFGGSTHSHKYYLAQVHFHWGELGDTAGHAGGSEHTVSGQHYPMEMHMVHVEDKFVNESGYIDWAAAKLDVKGLAVLAVFFEVDPIKPENMKPLQTVDNEVAGLPKPERRDAEENDHMIEMNNLQRAVEELNAKRVKRDDTGVKLRWNPGAMLRKATNAGGDDTMSTYFTYHGSLTTPGCEEVVTWVVFERPLAVAQVQINAFAALYPDNFRPVKTANVDQPVSHLIHGKIGAPKGTIG